MPTPVQAFTQAAAKHGDVDPTDLAAVCRFYRETLPTLEPAEILAILEELLACEGTAEGAPPQPFYPGQAHLPSVAASPRVSAPLLARMLGWCVKAR